MFNMHLRNCTKKGWIVKLNDDLSLLAYQDSKPNNVGETRELQKGLILTSSGKELNEEGVGFGVPVALFSDKPYFSKSAQLLVNDTGKETILLKRFKMNCIYTKGWRQKVLTDHSLHSFFYFFQKKIEIAYHNHRNFQKMMRHITKLQNYLGIKTCFLEVKPRGEITLSYKISSNRIGVKVDLRRLQKRNCKKVFILNEQGASFFRKYFDSLGLELFDDNIGVWDSVQADWACISDLKGKLSFRLKQFPELKMYRGREHLEGLLSWAGLAYELKPSKRVFYYEIDLKNGGKEKSD